MAAYPPGSPSPASLSSAPLGSPGTKSPPRSSPLLRPLRRSRSNGLRTAVPQHTPLPAAEPAPPTRRQRGRAAPSAPISFRRRLPAPPAPLPLDCGRRKPLHERAPERTHPGAAAPPPRFWRPTRTRARCSCRGGRRLARAQDGCQGGGPGAGGRGWTRRRTGSVCAFAVASLRPVCSPSAFCGV